MAYRHHRVALFSKKASQERLASRISALLDITLNDDDGLLNLKCAKCKQSLETVMIDLTKFKRSVAVLQSELTCHCNILITIPYRVQTLTSHNTEESENTPESPYLGEIKRMRKQCVPGSLLPRSPRAWV